MSTATDTAADIEWKLGKAYVADRLIAVKHDVWVGPTLGVWDTAANRMRWELIPDGWNVKEMVERMHACGRAPEIPAHADLNI